MFAAGWCEWPRRRCMSSAVCIDLTKRRWEMGRLARTHEPDARAARLDVRRNSALFDVISESAERGGVIFIWVEGDRRIADRRTDRPPSFHKIFSFQLPGKFIYHKIPGF